MKEIFTWTVTIWNMYWGTGWIQYLLALGGICILIFGRKSKIGLRLLWYTAFLLVLFFCPVSADDHALHRQRCILACVMASACCTTDRRWFYNICK